MCLLFHILEDTIKYRIFWFFHQKYYMYVIIISGLNKTVALLSMSNVYIYLFIYFVCFCRNLEISFFHGPKGIKLTCMGLSLEKEVVTTGIDTGTSQVCLFWMTREHTATTAGLAINWGRICQSNTIHVGEWPLQSGVPRKQVSSWIDLIRVITEFSSN